MNFKNLSQFGKINMDDDLVIVVSYGALPIVLAGCIVYVKNKFFKKER